MQIQIQDLTIRQLRGLGEAVGIEGFGEMDKKGLQVALKAATKGPKDLQRYIDKLTAPEAKKNGKATALPDYPVEGMTSEQLEQARLDAIMDIAKASTERNRAEEALRATRQTLNQEVAEAKAAHKGAMERSVDYDNAEEVNAKLLDVTEAWQDWEDAQVHRREELQPLMERLSKARARERDAYVNSKQLKLF